MTLTGVMAGPIAGLKYETPTRRGLTNERGEFHYEEGERVAFLLGGTAIGNVPAAPRLHLAQIVARVDGDLSKLKDPGVTNIARLVFSLGRNGIRDNGTDIAPEAHDIIGDRPIDFRHDANFAGVHQADKIQGFTEDPVLAGLLADLDRAGVFIDATPRQLCTPANARNELRRNAMGILRFRDVKIPLQNGSHVFADVFRPAEPGNHPVIVSCGPYGKAFHHHSVCSDADLERHEQMEEDYFLGNAEGQQFENHETVNTATWVPDGYAVVRVDMPGAGRSPGQLAPWGLAGAEAFRDAIEWAGVQPWSNGAVGLWGMSYLAVSQHAAASLQPAHLKAMIAIGTDVDLYEEVAYNGGIYNEHFFPNWKQAGFVPAICGEPDIADFTRIMKESPFKDSDPDLIYGPRAEMFMSPDMSEVTVPLWSVAATTHLAHFHQLGSSEAYLATPTPHKKLDFWEDWFQKSYAADTVIRHKAFFDHWLKGIDNGIMDTPPVRLEIRTGNGSSYIQEENEWPIARTNYTKWYFDASPSDWAGDPARTDYLRLSSSEPGSEREEGYSADVESADPRATGLSFISEPVAEDSVLAGYGKAVLWVSSTSEDMDIYVSVRVIDEQDREVDFLGITTMNYPGRIAPMTKGWLKVSHRKLDTARSTPYTPKHTHLTDDHAPLRDGEVVPVEIELIPNTGLIRTGQRLRIDIQPYDGAAHGVPHAYDATYHAGTTNTVHTGPDRIGYVQLPIVPRRPAP
ncbi:CocE/NonD family hydrolase [Streptomyces sp. RKAG290]|uniref:CocE/NonD family hydrolase n=1 Tax=Streptomyces sp. RKAG290 TaxID=2888348 RepID=UPI0020333A9E|nr:CocE/NonD family hydrolase [Streptomyces sp. RKAG290]MCM2410772.1 CocE/NonD family hydrolase [Streptomyces sp. RKAG290]